MAKLMTLPFELSPVVDWQVVPMSSTVLMDFRDDRAHREFQRFLHRDLVAAFIGALYVGGCFTFPTILLDTGAGLIPNLVIGCVLALLVLGDVRLHFTRQPTFSVARIRRVIQVTIAMLVIVTTTWAATIAWYERCSNSLFPLRALIDPNLTPWRIQQYCRSIINPLLAVTIRTVSMLPFPPALALLPLGSCLVQDVLSRFAISTYGQFPESADDIAVKAVGMVLLCAISMAMMMSAHRSYMSSFAGEVAAAVERERSAKLEEDVDLLLCAMMPASALARLAAHCEVSDWTAEASVLHSDIVSFTAWSGSRSAHQVVAMLNRLWIDVDRLAETSGVSKVKTVGDAYWAVCGLPDEETDHAEKMCDFGHAMLERLQLLNGRHPEWVAICMRVGIHSGPLWGGVLGTRQLSYEVFGPTTAIAEAVEKAGVPSRVAISGSTLSRLGLSASVGEPYSRLELTENEGALAGEETYLLQRMTVEQHRRLERAAVMSLLVPQQHRAGSPNSRKQPSEDSSQRSGASFRSGRAPGQFLPTTSVEAKQHRMRFLSERAALTATEPTVEEVEARCSERRWRWFLFDFADPTVEQEYLHFASHHTHQTRLLGRVFVLLLVVYVAFGIAMNSGHFPTHTAVLLLIAGAIAVADLLLVAERQKHRRSLLLTSLAMDEVAAFLLLAAAGTAPPGTSVATNEITYLFCDLAVHTAFANVGVASAAPLSLFNLVVFVPLAIGLMWNSVMLFEGAALVILAWMVQSFGLVVREKRYRRLFLEARVAAHFKRQQERRRHEQGALLESVVPPHIVPALIDWLSVDLDLSRTVMFTYPLIAVAFVRFVDTHPVGPVPDDAPVMRSSPDRSDHDASASLSSLNTLVPFDPPPYGHYRLFEVHRAVDDVVARFPAVCKIKSFGDSIMLAAPLVDSVDFATAATQLMTAIWELRADPSPQLQAGIHCGEAVGAVLGRSRLCFDIFGDTVNVASRTMTAGSPGQILVTEELVVAIRDPDDENSLGEDAFEDGPCSPLGPVAANGARFGPAREVAAKGKARLVVRELAVLGSGAVVATPETVTTPSVA